MEMPARYTISSSSRPARRLPAPPAPEQREPRHRRDGERGDGVDLGLVGVLPVGEGEGAEHRARGRAAEAEPRGSKSRQRLVRDEEKAAGAGRAQERAEQVGPEGVLADRKQHGPDVRDHHEQRRARRVRNAEHPRGGDELARIPEGDPGREREHVPGEHGERHGERGPVRRPRRRLAHGCAGAAAGGPAGRPPSAAET